jgi:murein DD-endopeptidase MepM/ murein hydrolase activator NlpD
MGFLKERTVRFYLAAGLCAAAVVAVSVLIHTRAATRFLPEGPEVLRVSTGTFTSSLDAALKAEGLGDSERYRVSQALRGKLDLRRLRPQDSYSVSFSTSGALLSLSVKRDLRDYYVLPSSGGYSVSVRQAEIKSSSAKASGEISSSLWESMSAAGVPPAVILDYADIFSWSVDFLTEVRDGDRWAVAWNYGSDPSGRTVSQSVAAAYYDGTETGRKTAAAYAGGYYDEQGDSLRSMFLRAPLHYRRISSYFTNHRFHPVLKIFRPHQGIDYAAPAGTPVSAVADGTVIYSGWKGANGRLVILRHGSGYESTYGHLSRIAKGARKGRRVAQGDLIGNVGSSGLSSGPHLDFRVKLNGTPLNFLKMKYRSSGSVSGNAKASIAAAIRALGE